MFTLATAIPAFFIHLLHYSDSRLRGLLTSATNRSFEDTSALDAPVRLKQTLTHRLPGFMIDWATYASISLSMWVGVRLMDRGILSSLWPWAVVPGCVLLGVVSAFGRAWRRWHLLGLQARFGDSHTDDRT